MNLQTMQSLGNSVLDSLHKRLQHSFDEIVKMSATMSDQGKLRVRTDAHGIHYALNETFDASTTVYMSSGKLSKSVRASQHFSKSCAKELASQILTTVGLQALGYDRSQFKRVLVSIDPILIAGGSHHFHKQKMSLVVQYTDETFWINTRCSVYFIDRKTGAIGPRSVVEPRMSGAQLAHLVSQQALKSLSTNLVLGGLVANPVVDVVGDTRTYEIRKRN